MIEWAVEAAKLAAAEAEMLQALAAYKDAVNHAKSAGEDLASKWEGDAREVFVAEQANAYRWHISMCDIVSAFAQTVKSTADKYLQAEQTITKIIREH